MLSITYDVMFPPLNFHPVLVTVDGVNEFSSLVSLKKKIYIYKGKKGDHDDAREITGV